MRTVKTIPLHLRDIIQEIREVAKEEYGLDFFETIFEMVDYKQMNEIAAYGGFPTRYPHWRFGMEYEQLSKSSEYGLSKIYEMVINNDPSYAYLLEGNNLVDQKTVIAHVYAHVDFFKNNYYFSKTNRKMVDEMANHGARIRRYVDRRGIEKVEDFIDTCLSLDNLIDYYSPFIERRRKKERDHDDEPRAREIPKFKAKDYMDEYINPQDYIEEQKRKLQEEAERLKKFPPDPEKDVMLFLLEHAPLEGWEADILSIIREEAYYFAPQGQTKIMNEGWASYWHSKILTERVLTDAEIIDFADINSKVMFSGQGQLNPYKLGVALYRDIEERWNKGKFGKEWDEVDDLERKSNWDKQLGLGRKKIFEVRKLYNDVTFIDEFMTEEFARENKMFTFGYNRKTGNWEIESREFKKIKEKLLTQLTNFGQPFIYVKDGNFKNRGELLLHHKFDGTPLRLDYAQGVLEALQRVWKRPVNIETISDDKGVLLSYDGTDHKQSAFDYEPI
ncbi:SpoVR family protein [Persicimonas caeni]|uniref:SpoVR family protein n=1 Tax=Persicimonas caeni TaxID=2292766 RepID=A0A4Y6PQ66_PERCE|nr:SpoVR family protein [Persicimonas caeni]QDG49905.1 SpoVR family protein [Persicimonas caeni]QED31126.1 SpoVR family protein [Persicimonas caeni]